MKKYIKKADSFSLVEIMISITILMLVLILMFPVVTQYRKHNSSKFARGGSALFLYNYNNLTNEESFVNYTCAKPSRSYDYSSLILSPRYVGKCQKYEFVIPKGVYRINLTMVAGGGGGGGAAGSMLYTKDLYYGNTTSSGTYLVEKLINVPKARIKELKINALVGKGADGSNYDGSSNSSQLNLGTGGRSGTGLFDAVIMGQDIVTQFEPKLYVNEFDPKVDLSFITQSDVDSIRSSNSYYSSLSSFAGLGFLVDTKTSDGSYTRNVNMNDDNYGLKGYYVADGSVSSPSYMLFLGIPNNTYGKASNAFTWLNGDTKAVKGFDSEQYWAINEANIMYPVPGKTSVLTTKGYTASGVVLQGGEGGSFNYAGRRVGAGGRGQSRQFYCANYLYCQFNNNINGVYGENTSSGYENYPTVTRAMGRADYQTSNSTVNFQNFGHVTLTLEHPGGVGSGGVGGNLIRVLNFPVKPGAKYTIVVGAGGKGGSAGHSGRIMSDGSLMQNATVGYDGEAGSSTAIYDEEGNTLFLVIGGIGGFGGYVNTGALTVPVGTTVSSSGQQVTTIDYSNYAPNPDLPRRAEFANMSFFGTKSYYGHTTEGSLSRAGNYEYLNYDPKYILYSTYKFNSISGGEYNLKTTNVLWYTPGGARQAIKEDINLKRMVYTHLYDLTSPYYALSINTYNPGSTTNINPYTQDYNGYFGSFSGYYKPSSSENGSYYSSLYNYVSLNSPVYETFTGGSSNYVYNGLYYKNVDASYSFKYYPGGLGGFSPLGTKAGCGGFFMGNEAAFGRDERSISYEPNKFQGTFGLPINNQHIFFKRDDFFDGCTYSTPNGHTAEFIPPQYSVESGEYLGAAGAGGGGGGWNMQQGSGSGGDGQNGYVFITWNRPEE